MEPTDSEALFAVRDLAHSAAEEGIREEAMVVLAAAQPDAAVLRFLLDRAVADPAPRVRSAATRAAAAIPGARYEAFPALYAP